MKPYWFQADGKPRDRLPIGRLLLSLSISVKAHLEKLAMENHFILRGVLNVF